MVNEEIFVTVGFSAAVNAQMGISTVQETITVTGQTPSSAPGTAAKQTFTNELLQFRLRATVGDLQQTAASPWTRNVGGNMSGQQSNYVSRGGNPFNNKWAVDGIDITDMAATGSFHLARPDAFGDDDQYRRRRRDAADRRRRHQPRDQERHRHQGSSGA